MNESEQILVLGGGPEISQVGYPLVDGTASGQLALSDSAPHIGTLPVPVVEGQRWVKDPEDVEYLGVGGVWVPQPTKSQGVWMWDGSQWVFIGNYFKTDEGYFIVTDSGNKITVDYGIVSGIVVDSYGNIVGSLDSNITGVLR